MVRARSAGICSSAIIKSNSALLATLCAATWWLLHGSAGICNSAIFKSNSALLATFVQRPDGSRTAVLAFVTVPILTEGNEREEAEAAASGA